MRSREYADGVLVVTLFKLHDPQIIEITANAMARTKCPEINFICHFDLLCNGYRDWNHRRVTPMIASIPLGKGSRILDANWN